MARRRKPNRGVVLLVVISLLVLFVLIAVTFALVAGQYRSTARTMAKVDAHQGQPETEVEKALYVLLRDTKFRSSLQGHALLSDLYGPGARGRVAQATGANPNPVVTAVQGQFIRIFFDGWDTSRNSTGATAYNNRLFQPLAGIYNGRVLTMLSGNAKGLSTRIVAYNPPQFNNMGVQTSQGEFRVEAFESDVGGIVAPTAGDRFLVNGGAFNGSGAGYSAVTGNIDQLTFDPGPDGGWGNAGIDDNNNMIVDDLGEAGFPGSDDLAIPVVLAPNYSAHMQQAIPPLFGGANEPYDSPDYNNMFLASVPFSNPVTIPINSTPVYPVNRIYPSFHRPDLVNFWFKQLQGSVLSSIASPADQALVFWFPYGISNDRTGPDVDLRPVDSDGDGFPETPGAAMGVALGIRDTVARIKRMIMLRPLNELNPGFAQSNIAFMRGRTLSNGNWEWNFTPDVDTDGDGVKDSVWVDLGFPPTTGKDGRRFKALVAVKIEDLDGRLDINAHSSFAHNSTNWTTQYPIATSAGQGAGFNPLPRGSGYGPAEVNLSRLFQGEFDALLNSRYGLDTRPGAPGNDALSLFKAFELVDNYFLSLQLTSSYASPPDVWGRGAIALDHFGGPQFLGGMGSGETVDDPYEFNRSEPSLAIAGGDAPFTAADLERVLRYHDAGAVDLSSRLLNVAPFTLNYGGAAAQNRHLITTESAHIPVINSPYPDLKINNNSIRQGIFSKSPFSDHSDVHVLQLYRRRLLAGGVTQANLVTELAKMVPMEVLHGEMFDINRPIGNAIDDNNNGVIDEPLEGGLIEGIWNASFPPYSGRATANRLNDDPVIADPTISRQIMARHLYCLAMLMKEDGVEIDFNGNPGDDTPLETAYGLAQWAVNVVDFRDSDAIMTPFEFDINPFQDGWQVNGLIGQADANSAQPDDNQNFRGLVWGCERPELLISENLAFHDRRTEDLSGPASPAIPAIPGVMPAIPASPGHNTTTAANNPDPHFDQRLRPRGSFFVELYNPWTADTKMPAELYSTVNGETGIFLNRRVNGNGTPIWRLVVVKGNNLSGDLDSPDPAIATPIAPADVERTVYFTDPGVQIGPGQQYFTSNNIPIAPLLPGRFAVIGPPGEIVGNPNSYATTIGRSLINQNNDGAGVLNTRRIILTPNASANVDQVSTSDTIPAPGNVPPGLSVKPEPIAPTNNAPGDRMPAIAVVVDSPLGLSVSEPTVGYTNINFDPNGANGEGAYNPIFDQPLDWDRENDQLRINQTIASFRIVHLQRLADPTQNYDAVANPYRTIDSMYVNLTVFNGVRLGETNGETRFHSLQRGDSESLNPYPYAVDNNPLVPVGGEPSFSRQLWRNEPPSLAAPGPVPSTDTGVQNLVSDHVYKFGLRHSLGYLNNNYWPYMTAAAAPNLNYRGAPDARHNSTNNRHAFPWLTWNNRPFNSPAELMLVPWPRSSRLLTRIPDATVVGTLDPYTQQYLFADPGNPKPSHLLNFFHSTGAPANPPAKLFRIFDYVNVRSPYVGTEKWYFPGLDLNNDGDYSDAGEYPGFGGAPYDPLAATFRPPYNRLSRFRDPGRINFNTVAIEGGNSPALAAILGDGIDPAGLNPGSLSAAINNIRLSRQGFADPAPANEALYNPDFPTMFSNPLRSEASADMMPAIGTGASHMRRDGQGTHQGPIDATILRRGMGGTTPLFDNTATDPYADTRRNPYFRFQAHTKVNNLLTGHSNVFAIWITVGYFELEPTNVSPINPDGFRLGREVGSETGDVRRHRAFYMVDRSIPVAYEPGENHNVDRCILLRRVIE